MQQILFHICHQQERLEFTTLFNSFIQQNIGGFVEKYLQTEEGFQIPHLLVKAYPLQGETLFCGSMLRECLHHPAIVNYCLTHFDILRPLFTTYHHSENKDLRMDVLLSLRVLLFDSRMEWTRMHLSHVPFSLSYHSISRGFTTLLSSEYTSVQNAGLAVMIARWIHVQMLSEFLSQSIPVDSFLESVSLLEVVLQLLYSADEQTQCKAFHIFQVALRACADQLFLQSEIKPSIRHVLRSNREKLVALCSALSGELELSDVVVRLTQLQCDC